MNIGNRIKEIRIDNKLTQAQIAKKLNVTQDSISLWENNKRLPDTQYIIEICKIFNIKADYLLCLEDETGSKTYNNFGIHNGDVNF